MLPEIGTCITTRQAEGYYSHTILRKTTSFYYSPSESSYPSNPHPHLQNQESNTNTTTVEKRETKDQFLKRILVVDDEPDVTLTFKVGLEGYYDNGNNDKRRFEVSTYNNPLEALSEFKSNFYDLMLIDVYMPGMNGFQFCEKVLEFDANVRVCFISAAELNMQALREVYPKVSFGCFIKKPVTIDYLVEKLSAELD
jgi:CheY-like chemotaxis protein